MRSENCLTDEEKLKLRRAVKKEIAAFALAEKSEDMTEKFKLLKSKYEICEKFCI